MISPSQRPLPDNTQHSQKTTIHAPGGIQTHNLSGRAALDRAATGTGIISTVPFFKCLCFVDCAWKEGKFTCKSEDVQLFCTVQIPLVCNWWLIINLTLCLMKQWTLTVCFEWRHSSPHVLILSTRWSLPVSLSAHLLYTVGKSSWYLLAVRLDGSKNRSWLWWWREKYLPGIYSQWPVVTILIEPCKLYDLLYWIACHRVCINTRLSLELFQMQHLPYLAKCKMIILHNLYFSWNTCQN